MFVGTFTYRDLDLNSPKKQSIPPRMYLRRLSSQEQVCSGIRVCHTKFVRLCNRGCWSVGVKGKDKKVHKCCCCCELLMPALMEVSERLPLLQDKNHEGQKRTLTKNIGFIGGVSLLVNSMTGPALISIPAVIQVNWDAILDEKIITPFSHQFVQLVNFSGFWLAYSRNYSIYVLGNFFDIFSCFVRSYVTLSWKRSVSG